ncbi:MAG: DMT family transporter, partial [Lentilitoribacter sp.]
MSIASADLFSAMAIQNLAAWLVSMGFVWFLGERQFEVQLATFLLLIWGIVVLSGAGLFLMVWLVRRVTASKVSVLLLLAPPLAAIESYFIFNETLTSLQIAGFVVTIFGVYISQLKGKA